MSLPEAKPDVVYYPESDGQPMAESDRHRQLMFDLIAAARYHFRATPDVYASGNLLLYWVKGDPTVSVAPDFFVVRGVPKGDRRVYKVWEEGKGPEVVIELTSTSTHREDLGKKRAIYEELGVREYFLFDPEGIRFQPQLRGFRLEGGTLLPVAPASKPDGALVLPSAVLGLELHAFGNSLRLVDPRTGVPVPVPEDVLALVEATERRANAEERRADAEKRRADAEKERAEAATQLVEAQKRQTEAERCRASAEKDRADAAESRASEMAARAREAEGQAKGAALELARLREELDRARRGAKE